MSTKGPTDSQSMDVLYFSYHAGYFFSAYRCDSQALKKPLIKTFVGVSGALIMPLSITAKKLTEQLPSGPDETGTHKEQTLLATISVLGISCSGTMVSKVGQLQ